MSEHPRELLKLAERCGATVKDLGSVWVEFDAGQLADFTLKAIGAYLRQLHEDNKHRHNYFLCEAVRISPASEE